VRVQAPLRTPRPSRAGAAVAFTSLPGGATATGVETPRRDPPAQDPPVSAKVLVLWVVRTFSPSSGPRTVVVEDLAQESTALRAVGNNRFPPRAVRPLASDRCSARFGADRSDPPGDERGVIVRARLRQR
jgi:hypothetical protein